MKRILVLRPDDDELNLFRGADRREIVLALRTPIGDVGEAAACLVFQGDQVAFVARVEPQHRTGELNYLFKFSEVTESPSWNASDLRSILTTQQLRPFDDGRGVLGEKATARVLDLIGGQSSAGALLKQWLNKSDRHIPLEKSANLAGLREGTMLALKCAGMDATEIAHQENWGGADADDLFLPPAPFEDDMVAHDMKVFMGMKRKGTSRLASAVFEDDMGRSLRVYNVNMKPSEGVLGSDLVYYHVERQSVVLVQYKRMARESGDWIYRPDRQFDKQASSFRSFEGAVRQKPIARTNEFRLSNSSCFFKLCRMDTYEVGDFSLSHGSYIANDQLSLHLESDSSLGSRGGRMVREGSCDGSLTNSLFADCVAYGLIGTRPLTKSELEELVRGGLRTSSSTVVGVFSNPMKRRPGPARPVRRKAPSNPSTLF